MEPEKTKALIVVKGGVVQSIYSSDPNLDFDILDFDNEELGSSELEERLLETSAEEMVAIY